MFNSVIENLLKMCAYDLPIKLTKSLNMWVAKIAETSHIT